MPADKNLICFSNVALLATGSTSPAVDIGMGGTPITHPLVMRVFWASAAATATMTVNVEASYDNTTFRQVASGVMVVGPGTEALEGNVRFITRRRYVRANLTGATATGVSANVNMAARSSPELSLD